MAKSSLNSLQLTLITIGAEFVHHARAITLRPAKAANANRCCCRHSCRSRPAVSAAVRRVNASENRGDENRSTDLFATR